MARLRRQLPAGARHGAQAPAAPPAHRAAAAQRAELAQQARTQQAEQPRGVAVERRAQQGKLVEQRPGRAAAPGRCPDLQLLPWRRGCARAFLVCALFACKVAGLSHRPQDTCHVTPCRRRAVVRTAHESCTSRAPAAARPDTSDQYVAAGQRGAQLVQPALRVRILWAVQLASEIQDLQAGQRAQRGHVGGAAWGWWLDGALAGACAGLGRLPACLRAPCFTTAKPQATQTQAWTRTAGREWHCQEWTM